MRLVRPEHSRRAACVARADAVPRRPALPGEPARPAHARRDRGAARRWWRSPPATSRPAARPRSTRRSRSGANDPTSQPETPVIRLANLDRFYQAGPTRTYVLRRIDLDDPRGRVRHHHGTVRGGEVHPARHPRHARPRLDRRVLAFWASRCTRCRPKKRVELNKRYIGFVFQKYHLLDDLTVYENLEIPLSYRDVKPKERAAIVAETLDRFQMVGKKDLYPEPALGRPAAARGRGAGGDRRARSCCWPTSRPATCTARRARRSWSCSPGSTGRGPRSCR